MKIQVPYTVYIRKNDSGEVRSLDLTWTVDLEDCNADYIKANPADFYYSEGNGKCDCNRELLFYDWENMNEVYCSEDRFSVKLEHGVTKEIYYSEY